MAEERIFTIDHDLSATAVRLQAAEPDALVSLGFGFGVMRLNETLDRLGGRPPRYTGTAWQDAFISRSVREAYLGWIGLDLYDEENPVGVAFLDRFASPLRPPTRVLRARGVARLRDRSSSTRSPTPSRCRRAGSARRSSV